MIHSIIHSKQVHKYSASVQFMGSPICFVDKYKFLGLSISRDILNRDIQLSINTFNRKCNEVRFDFPF